MADYSSIKTLRISDTKITGWSYNYLFTPHWVATDHCSSWPGKNGNLISHDHWFSSNKIDTTYNINSEPCNYRYSVSQFRNRWEDIGDESIFSIDVEGDALDQLRRQMDKCPYRMRLSLSVRTALNRDRNAVPAACRSKAEIPPIGAAGLTSERKVDLYPYGTAGRG
jgi:hypothetical protein